jgi:hypothetical protein
MTLRLLEMNAGDNVTVASAETEYRLPANSLAYNVSFKELKPETEYKFEYWTTDPAAKPESTVKLHGTFKTHPSEPESFSFLASSCIRSMSESQAWSSIKARMQADKADGVEPLFFANLGDLHYSGTRKSKSSDFQKALHEVFKSVSMRNFL